MAGGAAVSRFRQFFRVMAAGSPDQESLGAFNRRLARLHGRLVGRRVEARVICGCGQELEVALPMQAIADAPDPLAHITIGAEGRAFRLPHLSEIALASDPAALARLCALDGGDAPDPEGLAALDRAWAAADPAADIALDLCCPACGAAILAHADLALFVARDLDLKVRGLMAEVHGLARAYGWTEAEVLAVPAARRRVYAAFIDAVVADARFPGARFPGARFPGARFPGAAP